MNSFDDELMQKEIQREFFSRSKKLVILILNYIPLFQVSLIIYLMFLPWEHQWEVVIIGLSCLYLLPPILARLIRMIFPIREGKIAVNSKELLVWWALMSLQTIFNRFPWLEESLRIVPGLYSQWMRLWGAKIGRLTYWSAGTIIIDRSFVEIGNDVILGSAVRINPHVLARSSDGHNELILATVKIGDRAMIGAYSLLTAGTEIAADENTQAFLISPPFTKWEEGHRIKPEGDMSVQSYKRRPYK